MSGSSFPPVADQLATLKQGAVDLVEEDQLRQMLERSRERSEPLTVKAGFDPSAPDLHLGHSVLLRKMRQFQRLGHRVVFVVGDFTARIGDPSGRKATRPQLSEEEIDANLATYEAQMWKLLDRPVTVVERNSRWLAELGAGDLIRLAGQLTLARMLERDDFRTRYAENQSIGLHELLYPLVQGYDSVALECDVELGGHDQIFNLLVGRDLMRQAGLEPQVVLTVPLLVGTDGTQKMSKSLGNAIGLEDPPAEIYGKTMSIPDALMWEWYLLLTEVTPEEIDRRRQEVDEGRLHPKALKQELARRLVADYHDEDAARRAEEEFEQVFAQGGVPEAIPEAELGAGEPLFKLLAAAGLASSNSEARRLVEQGAVSVDGDREEDPFAQLAPQPEPYLVKVGKRRFLNLRLVE